MKLPKKEMIFLPEMMNNLTHRFCQNRLVTQAAKVRHLVIQVTRQTVVAAIVMVIQNLTTVRPAQHRVFQIRRKIKKSKKPKNRTLT